MLFHDHFYGHRDYFTGEPIRDPYWTEWDYALADAVSFMQDYTDSHGHLIWERDADYVEAVAVKKIDKAQAAIDSKTKGSKNKPYQPSPGETFQTVLRIMPGYEDKGWPTFDEWAEEQEKLLGSVSENP
jgi:hypothetical protein